MIGYCLKKLWLCNVKNISISEKKKRAKIHQLRQPAYQLINVRLKNSKWQHTRLWNMYIYVYAHNSSSSPSSRKKEKKEKEKERRDGCAGIYITTNFRAGDSARYARPVYIYTGTRQQQQQQLICGKVFLSLMLRLSPIYSTFTLFSLSLFFRDWCWPYEGYLFIAIYGFFF